MVSSVDGRFPLSFYFRVANQIVEQAKVCREEGHLNDLFFILNRYVRLVSEVIPQHWSYLEYSSEEKLYHNKMMQEFSREIESLKPLVGGSDEIREQLMTMTTRKDDASNLTSQRRDEKDWAFADYNEKVAYCGSVGLCHSFESTPSMDSIELVSGIELDGKNTSAMPHASFHDVKVYAVRHFFPSVDSWIEDLPIVGHVSHVDVPESRSEHLEPSNGESSRSNAIRDVHISVRLMEEFMELAKENTEKNMETCGILGAFPRNQTFYVTTLVVPKQESTSSSCQALNEEEIHAVLEEQSLFPAGWIHTHPSQTCFLSSIDLHTQYSYQVMLPEAVAIVMAPTDPTRRYGIFRLTDPGGITVIRECNERGFHPHSETSDGSPIYENCSHIYFNPNMRFEIVDLRHL